MNPTELAMLGGFGGTALVLNFLMLWALAVVR